MQSIPQRRHVRRYRYLDPADRCAVERMLVGRFGLRRTARSRGPGIGRTDVEVRPLAVVTYQERVAVLQSAMEVHDGVASAGGGGSDAPGCLKDETAGRCHQDSLH
jgi:hypothetical protein